MTSDVALSIDVELFAHTPAYRSAEGELDDETVGIEGVEFLLDAFERYDVESTFFVVSEIAESHPDVVEGIAERGHEIGSHTHSHRLLSKLSQDECRQEMVRSKQILEDVSHHHVPGFRAPAFDRPDGFFEGIAESGYEYDSSIVPARAIPGWYGGEFSRGEPGPASAFDDSYPDDVIEVPASVTPGLRVPISAAWIRLLGRRYFSTGIRLLHRRGCVPVVYVHPWEFVELPQVDGVPRRVYWRTGQWFRETVESLLECDYTFRTVGSLADSVAE